MRVTVILKLWDKYLREWIPRTITFYKVGQTWQSNAGKMILELKEVSE